jgi:hypothetical protein
MRGINHQNRPEDVAERGLLVTFVDDRCEEAEDDVAVVVWPSPPLNVVERESNEPWKLPPLESPATEDEAKLEFNPVNWLLLKLVFKGFIVLLIETCCSCIKQSLKWSSIKKK